MAWRSLLQGLACHTCADSYYRADDKLCYKCNSTVWVLYVLGFLIAVALVPLLLKVAKSQGFMSINILVGTLQVMSLLRSEVLALRAAALL